MAAAGSCAAHSSASRVRASKQMTGPMHITYCTERVTMAEGVGEVTVDSRADTVVVRGRGAVENAAEVVQVVERKTGEKAVLVSPSPPEKLLPPRSSAPKAKGGERETNTTKDIGNELPELDMVLTILYPSLVDYK